MGEAVILEGGIRVVVLASDRRGVRLGFEAPPGVRIQREELVAPIEEENRRAHADAASDWMPLIPKPEQKEVTVVCSASLRPGNATRPRESSSRGH